MPPESCFGKWFSKPTRPTLPMKPFATCELLVARQAALAQAEAHVLEHREPGKERVALEDHAAVGARASMRRPSSCTSPAVGRSSPATMRSSVLLPQPDGRGW
jgi:hypothetical protein